MGVKKTSDQCNVRKTRYVELPDSGTKNSIPLPFHAKLPPSGGKLQNQEKMSQSLQKTVRILEGISVRIGQAVAWLVLALAILTLVVAIPRYLLSSTWFLELHLFDVDWDAVRSVYSRNVNALNDGIQYIHATIFMLGVSYAMKLGDHVRIDIFYRGMSARKKAWVDILGVLFFLFPMFLFILVMSWNYVLSSWSIFETSSRPGGLSYVYVFKTLLLIMPVLMLLQGSALLMRRILELKNIHMGDDTETGESV